MTPSRPRKRLEHLGGSKGLRPKQIALLFALGTFMLQAAWSIAVPPFHGIDEFDHSYRASAVAHGQWRADPSDATRGTGAVLEVSSDIVKGAGPFCRELPYTSDADCRPQGDAGDGLVYVASGAGRYNPAYYALVGWPDQLLDGDASLMAMRLLGSALVSGLVGVAAYTLARSGRGRLPLLGLLLALTPVAVYSGSIVAPNGMEIVAGVLLWCVVLALSLGTGIDRASRKRFMWAAVLASVLLVTLRSLGPLWLALILIGALPLVQPRDLRHWTSQARQHLSAIGVVAVAGLLSTLWILTNRSLEIAYESGDVQNPIAESVQQVPLWLFQSIAAFPFRDNPAPAGIYALILVPASVLVTMGFKRASRPLRLSLLFVIAVAILVPVAITMRTIDEFGVAWQGRYGLPFSVGLPLLASFAVALRPRRSRFPGLLVSGTVGLVGVAHVWSVLFVHQSGRAGDWAWASGAAAALLAVLGVMLWAVAVVRGPLESAQPEVGVAATEEPVVV